MNNTSDKILRYILAIGMVIAGIILLILTYGTDLGATKVLGFTLSTSQVDTLITIFVFGLGLVAMLSQSIPQ